MYKLIHLYTKDLSNYEPLFKNKKGDRLSRISAYRIIKFACDKICSCGNFGTHTLRKTFGYHFYYQFNDVVMLQQILNHSHPAITLRYIGIEQEKIYKTYSKFYM